MTELIIGNNVIKGDLMNFTIADTSIFRFNNGVEVTISPTPLPVVNMFRGAYGNAFSLDKIKNASVDFNHSKIIINKKEAKKTVAGTSGAKLDKETGFTQPSEPRNKPTPLISSKVKIENTSAKEVAQKDVKKTAPAGKKTSKV